MDIIFVNYDHNSKYAFPQTRHIFHLRISDLILRLYAFSILFLLELVPFK
jgi:hypothetical protein